LEVVGGGWKWKGWRLLAVARYAFFAQSLQLVCCGGGGGGETAKHQVKSHEKLDQIVI
jgi:hypothetical protein